MAATYDPASGRWRDTAADGSPVAARALLWGLSRDSSGRLASLQTLAGAVVLERGSDGRLTRVVTAGSAFRIFRDVAGNLVGVGNE